MQFAKRSSRPRTQLHPASSLADRSPSLSLPPPLESRPDRVQPLLFSRILDFKPEWPMRSDLFASPLPGIHIHAASISSVDSICIVKIGNYTVTRVSCPFVSLRFIRRIAITYYRSIRDPPFHRVSIGFSRGNVSLFHWREEGL